MRGLTTLVAFAIASSSHLAAVGQSQPFVQSGNSYVESVLQTLKQPISIVAKLRHESHLLDQKLVGSGNYWQKPTNSGRVVRWEMTTQLGDQTASFVQVYDNEDRLWTDRRLPSRRQVTRLNVTWLREQLRKHYRTIPADERQLLAAVSGHLTGQEPGQGGLAQMLGSLLLNFNFQPPQPAQRDGLPVHALLGHWRPEQLEKHWPESANLTSDEPPIWPAQLPHHVLLLVDGSTRGMMFPRVCEHRSADDAALATSLAGLRPANKPLLRYEVFDEQFAVAIPDERFEFISAGLQWTDESARVLEQLTRAVEPVEPRTAARR